MPPKQILRKTTPAVAKTTPTPPVVTNPVVETKDQKPKKKFQVYPIVKFNNEEILNIDVKNIVLQKPEEDNTTYKNFWGTIYYKGPDGKLNWLYIRLDGYFCFGIKRFNEDGQPSETAPYSTGLALLDEKEMDPIKSGMKVKIFKKLEEVEQEIRRQFLPFAAEVGKDWINSMEHFETTQGRKDCRLVSYSKKDAKRTRPSLKTKLWIFTKNGRKMCGTQIFETGKKTKTGNPVSFSSKFTQYKNMATVSAVSHLKSLFISSSEKGYIAVQFQLMAIEFPADYHKPFVRPSLMHEGVVGGEEDMEVEEEVNDVLANATSETASSKANDALANATSETGDDAAVTGEIEQQDQ